MGKRAPRGAAVALVLGLCALVVVGPAPALPSNCSQHVSTETCTFTYTGAEQTFDVPNGVTDVSISAIGAAGGTGGDFYLQNGAGGAGGTASADVSVTPGSTLYVEVGGAGSGGAGGWNGGGNGPNGGGGASDVRTVSCASDCAGGGSADSLNSRVLVAGGGGGGGFGGIDLNGRMTGGGGGAAGSNGADGLTNTYCGINGQVFPCGQGGGGTAGTADTGGAGGAAGSGMGAFASSGQVGQDGALGVGGVGGVVFGWATGGGGGGGYYGGGGGGAGGSWIDYGCCDPVPQQVAANTPGGGGGGGSSYAPGGTTGVASAQTPASVSISYTLPDAAPAITSTDHATFIAGAAGSFAVTSTGSPAPALSATGTLPAGMSFVDNGDTTASLSGTPSAGSGGIYPLTLGASNGVGLDASQDFTLTVDEAPALTSADHVTFTLGAAGNLNVTTTGWPLPSLSETGALPDGVSFVDNGDGTASLSGTPTAGGTYPVTIGASNGVGSDASQAFTLSVVAAPAITSVGHAHFGVGEAGSFTVTATGAPLPTLSETGALPDGLSFTDNGDGTATLAGTPTAAGVFPLTIHGANGVGSDAAQGFTLTVEAAASLPQVKSVAPTSGVAGTKVALAGTALTGVTEVDFAGSSSPATIVSQTATKLVVLVPADATLGPFTVHSGVGSFVTAASFKPLPKISALSIVDGAATDPVTITGTNLTGASAVKFGTVSASVTPVSATEVDTAVPDGFSSGKVTVTTPDGSATSSQVFAVTKAAGLSPPAAHAGATVTISGQGLGSTTAVDFAGAAGVVPLSTSPTAVKVVVPAGAVNGPLTIHTPNIDSASTTSFKPLPTLGALTPTRAGESLVVAGGGFEPMGDAPVVKLGSATLTPTGDGNTGFTVDLPANAVTGKLTVTTPNGTTSAVLKVPPTISDGPTPSSGAVGTVVHVTGLTFTGTKSVKFANGVSAAFKVTGTLGSTQTLTFKVPAHAGSGKITITNAGGSTQTTGDFTVTS